MVTSVHLLVGAAIGKATGNFSLTIPVAFFSHYILDAVPHYNQQQVKGYLKKGFWECDKKDLFLKSIEPIVGIGIVTYAAFTQKEFALIMIIGAFFAWLPDFFVFLEWKFNNNSGIIKKIEKIYHHHTTFWRGILPQIIISLLAILYIF